MPAGLLAYVASKPAAWLRAASRMASHLSVVDVGFIVALDVDVGGDDGVLGINEAGQEQTGARKRKRSRSSSVFNVNKKVSKYRTEGRNERATLGYLRCQPGTAICNRREKRMFQLPRNNGRRLVSDGESGKGLGGSQSGAKRSKKSHKTPEGSVRHRHRHGAENHTASRCTFWEAGKRQILQSRGID